MGLLPEVHRAQNSASIVGWIVSPPNVQVHPETQNVTLFGNSVFADITKGLEIKSSWIEDVISERRRGRVGHRDSGKRVTGRQRQKLELCCQRSRNRNHWKLKEARKHSPLEALDRGWLCWYFVFRLLISRTVRISTSIVLRYQLSSNSLRQP